MTLFKGSRAPTQHRSALLLPSLSYTTLQNKSLNSPYPQFIHFLAVQSFDSFASENVCMGINTWAYCADVQRCGGQRSTSSLFLNRSWLIHWDWISLWSLLIGWTHEPWAPRILLSSSEVFNANALGHWCGFWGSKCRASFLQSHHFTHYAISHECSAL